MALPVILVDSNTGSDSLSSGAGPSTAKNGTAAATNVAGTTVTITDAVDLSGVATDGSAALYFVDATAGHRNFDNISGVSGTSGNWTVTVVNGFTGSLSGKSWAIGGKRASIGGTNSTKLFSNNSAAGDAMPGWVVEMQSGHTETIAAAYVLRRAGDTTTGVITLRGTSGAATMPIITFSNNGNGILFAANYTTVRDFELRNSNATKTVSIGVNTSGAATVIVRNIRVNNSSNNFFNGIQVASSGATVRDCEVANTASDGITIASNIINVTMINCWVHACSGHGIALADQCSTRVVGCLLNGNTLGGISATTTTATAARGHIIMGNTIDANSSDGIGFSAATTQMTNSVIVNNIISNNTGYGINTAATAAYFDASSLMVAGNDFFDNSNGKYNPSGLTTSEYEQTSNPTFTNTAGNNYSIGINLRSVGYPVGGSLAIGTNSSTYSYVDIGVAQAPQAPANIAKVIQGIGTY